MAERLPPPVAMWLLKIFGPARYRESLAGDLIEQYGRGRSRGWCWQQVLAALVLARIAMIRNAPWVAAIKAALLALGVITLGFGTLSWASDSQKDSCAGTCRYLPQDPER